MNLICKRRNIAPGTRYAQERRKLGREIKNSLRQDRENWWLRKAEEMESAAASGNSAKLFQLIRETGSKGAKVSEVIEEKDGSLISNQERRLERWAEHFQSHFSNCQQPQPDSHPNTLPVSVWTVSNELPTETEVRDAIKRLKLRRAAGPDDLPPVLFKTGSATFIKGYNSIIREYLAIRVSPRKLG